VLTTTVTYSLSWIITYLFLREIRVQQQPDLAEFETDAEISSVVSTDLKLEQDLFPSAGCIDRPEADLSYNIELKLSFSEQVSSISEMYSGAVASPPDIMLSERQDGPITSSTNSTAESATPAVAAATIEYEVQSENLWVICRELVSSATFWRYAVLTLFLINLQTIFGHMDATLPTYLMRCFGPKYPKGMIYSINPFMIIWLTPIVSALTSQYAHYDMIKYGGEECVLRLQRCDNLIVVRDVYIYRVCHILVSILHGDRHSFMVSRDVHGGFDVGGVVLVAPYV